MAGLGAPINLEPFHALQRWLALSPIRRVTIPFGWALARAMDECSLELRTRRDFDALLACVKTIALLHQRNRLPAPGSGIEAIIDDYRVARDLLIGSFSAAAAESLTAGIREVVSEVPKTGITRPQLRELSPLKPRSTFYYHARQAIELNYLSEEKLEGKWVLRPNLPLPDKKPALPLVKEVEGMFLGVPAPTDDSEWSRRFSEDFAQLGGPEGITAAEWAAWVGQPVDVVRARLDMFFYGEIHPSDSDAERYVIRRVELPIDAPDVQGAGTRATGTAKSPSDDKSAEGQANSADVQPSNEPGGDVNGEDDFPERGLCPSKARRGSIARGRRRQHASTNCH